MATNYKMSEVVEILAKNEDGEAILDIGRRFPLLALCASRCIALAGDEFVKFANSMPEYVTALKANNGFKAQMLGDADDAEEDVKEEKPAKAAPKKRAAKAKAKEEPEEVDEDEDEAEEAEGYEAMNAMELFKECKKRKIKAQPKKTAKYYIGLLEKDDAAKAEAEADGGDEDDDDDWDI